MWQEELEEYILLTGKKNLKTLLAEESQLRKMFNLYTTTFDAEMLNNLWELMLYDHINRRFSLKDLEDIYALSPAKRHDSFMRYIDIMHYGSHIFRGLKAYSFDHPLFYLDQADFRMANSLQRCMDCIDELADCTEGSLREELVEVNDSMFFALEDMYDYFYQDTFLPQMTSALEQGNQKEVLRLFRKCAEKRDLYTRGISRFVDLLLVASQEVNDNLDEFTSYTDIYPTISSFQDQANQYQENTKIYRMQRQLFDRYKNENK